MIHILDYNEATHLSKEYFWSYFKGGDATAVTDRLTLLEKFGDVSQVVRATLSADDQHQLEALWELFSKFSEVEIIVVSRPAASSWKHGLCELR